MGLDFESRFDKDPSLIYMNSGSHSLCPRTVIESVKRHLEDYEKNPTAAMFNSWSNLWLVQKKIAPHFGAEAKNFFFRSNVTQPLNEFILGLQLPAGGEILTSNQEYGAVFNICRRRAERDQLELRSLALPSRHEIGALKKSDLVDRIVSSFSVKTKLLVLSEIYTGNGLLLPISEICKEARARGILTIIDGAHSPGFMDLDLENSNFDFYAGNLHKWWMGPKGTGFGWFRRELFHLLNPIQAGWISYELKEPFASFADGDLPAIRLLMLGCHDFSPYFALTETLRFWDEFGKVNIFSRKRQLDDFLVQEAERVLGYFYFASQDQFLRGPLHAFRMPERFSQMGFTKLIAEMFQQTKVQAVVTYIDGEMYLRLSPFIYNSEKEISESLQRLAKFLQN